MTEDRHHLTDAETDNIDRAVRSTLTALGFDLSDPKELKHIKADFLYMRKQRLGSEEIARIVKKSAITICLGGLLYTFIQGVKIALTMKGIGQ